MPDERPTTRSRHILSVPLKPDQHADLVRRAGREPVSAYARALLFPANDNAPSGPARTRTALAVRDHVALASLLARIGQQDTAHSLRELAHLAKIGALPVSPEVEAAIAAANADIADIKALLMKALGIGEA